MLQSISRIAGVAGFTVSILSTVPSPGAIPGNGMVGVAASVAAYSSPLPVSRGRLLVPVATVVAELSFDADSQELLSDESLLRSLEDENQETTSFGLEGFVTTGAETIASLAHRYSLDIDALVALNGGQPDAQIPAGTRLTLYRGGVTLYEAEEGETLAQIARKFGSDELLLSVCNHVSGDVMSGGEKLFVPQGILERAGAVEPTSKPQVVIAARPAKKTAPKTYGKVLNYKGKGVIWPLRGKITSRYGWRHHPILNRQRFHKGIDIAAKAGEAIKAVQGGRVIFAGWRGASGRTVVIRHSDNLVSLYGHCSKVLVSKGQQVSQGTLVARAGSSGRATGTHLHFALRKGTKPVNPMSYLH